MIPPDILMIIQPFSLDQVIFAFTITDMFEGNYTDAHHSMSAPSIVHHHEFPFEHAHHVAPNPGIIYNSRSNSRLWRI